MLDYPSVWVHEGQTLFFPIEVEGQQWIDDDNNGHYTGRVMCHSVSSIQWNSRGIGSHTDINYS